MPTMTKRGSRAQFTPLLAAAALAAATAVFALQASAARTPSDTLLTTTSSSSSSSGRSLLGAGRIGAQAAAAPPPPPPPRRLTVREKLAESLMSLLPENLTNLLEGLLTAQGEAEDRDNNDPTASDALGDSGFNLSSASTPFVGKLIQEALTATRASTPSFVGNGDIIPANVQKQLCDGEFLRGGDGAGYNGTEADVSYAAAYPLNDQGVVPVGCLTGCIIGGGPLETIARVYGMQRTGTPSSWRGKCFSDEAVTQPANTTETESTNGTDASPAWQLGSLVTNRIQMNYGVFINRLFGLTEPVELYPGKVYVGESYFAPGERAVVIDYSDHDHEFASFRDEVREIYPGVYLGKMYALPGTELWGGVLALPPDSPPRFAINFILFGQPGQTTVQALQAPVPDAPGAQGTPFMLSSGGALSGGL